MAFDAAFASQAAFRAVMNCMARPGTIATLKGIAAPAPFTPATAALVKSLADYDSPIWLDASFSAAPETADWIRFHTGAPLTADPAKAAFALIADPQAMPALTQFAQGSEEYPDRSTTLIIQVTSFSGPAFELTGPGIKTSRVIAIQSLPANFIDLMADNRELFPRGVDLILTAGTAIAALPRSLRIAEAR
ncbi:MAG: phosphonate C-P lyase system protein PhnH [Rhodopseudomonas sp.]|nr:phosphonate C-P lyase system protein PhnH [Rhodopseudomonas sp.]